MNKTKDDYIKIRIHPEKKEALFAVAKKMEIDVSKILTQEIDKLIASAGEIPLNEGRAGQEDDLSQMGKITFRPLPGDELFLKHYASARDLLPANAMRLILRSWRTKNPPLPKAELSLLAVTSNQLAAIGRNLNQLVKLAHSGVSPQQDRVIGLIDQARDEMHRASETIDGIVRTNQTSWESDYA
jgi:antitoxin component of RelBE/YafQ-DinJ toxin-antitoxin module